MCLTLSVLLVSEALAISSILLTLSPGIPTLGSTLFKMHKGENYLGFPDTVLGDKVEHCYHALALHENRPNFVDTRFEVRKPNLEKGQHCKQVGVQFD